MTRSAAQPARTDYTVQAFVQAKRVLQPEPLRRSSTREGAIRLGERLAPAKAGVLVAASRSTPEHGDFDGVEILATHGRLPPELLEQLGA